MNKKVISIVAIIALVAILGVCLVACNADSYAKKLEGKGYEVAKMTDEEAEEFVQETGLNIEIVWGVGARKGTDMVTILAFSNKEDAESIANVLNMVSGITGMKAEAKGKIVFVGTEQGIKDAK